MLVRKAVSTIATLPKTNIAPEKWMAGRRSFPFGMAYFQGRAVKASGG